MAGPNYVLDKGFEAGEALNRFLFVTLHANEKVEQADAQGERCLGVVQETVSADDATNGRIAAVRLLGISRVIAGDTIAIGALVTSGADARAETAATGDVVQGIALQAAVDGDHMDVLLVPAGSVLA